MREWAYFDTSAVVKLYVKETGSTEVRQLIKKHRPLSSVLLILETLSTFSRRKAEGSLTEVAHSKAVAYFRHDLGFINQIDLTREVRTRAESVLLQQPIRTLDAVHICSALVFRDELELDRLPFITGDRKQKAGADAFGLDTVWVGDPVQVGLRNETQR